jgi:hypothetical protein
MLFQEEVNKVDGEIQLNRHDMNVNEHEILSNCIHTWIE